MRRRWRAGNSSFALGRRRPPTGDRGRGPGRVGAGRGAAGSSRVLAGGVRAGKVGWRGTPAGQARRSPGQSSRSAQGTVTGGRGVRGFLKRSERPGSASGGDLERTAPGPERREGGYRDFSASWEPRGRRELGVAPVGERLEVGRPGAAGVWGDRERRKAPSRVRTLLGRRAAVEGRRVCGVETLN